MSLRYVYNGKREGSAYIISLYENEALVFTYKGYISRYCNLEMKLYPYKKGVAKAPESHKKSICIFDIENFFKK